MGCLVKLFLTVLIIFSSTFVILCEDLSCSKDSEECGEEERSVMLDREENVEDLQDSNIKHDDEEGIVEENENLIERKDVIIDETEEVDGLFEPCTRTEYGGQLHKMLILHAGYKLAE